MEQCSDELPEEAWREITVAQGSQGPRTYMFSAQRVRVTRRRKPGEEMWAVWRRNLDGSEPRHYLSNAPEDTTLETLACVGGSRWRIETEFETEKGDVGLDEYETRSWAGVASPHSHVPAGWSVPAEPAAGLGGERCPGSRGRRCTGWCGRCCPGSSSGPINCCCGWRIRSYATSGRAVPTRDAAPPAAKAGWSRHLKPVVVVLVWQLEFADARGGAPIYLAQCASGNNWVDKVNEPSIREWTKIVDFAVPPNKAFSLPFSLSERELRRQSNRAGGLLVDRYRLLAQDVSEDTWIPGLLRGELIDWLDPRIDWIISR